VQGILAALIERQRCGLGQIVETSLLQGLMPFDLLLLLLTQLTEREPEVYPQVFNIGGGMPTLNYHPVMTRDGRWIQLGNLLEHLFYAFMDAADLTVADGVVFAVGAPGYGISVADLARRALMKGVDIVETAYTEFENAPTYAVHCAEVDIDIDTGELTVNRMLAVQDVGTAINPTIVEGQIEGATHQGLGYALTEELIVDEGGVLVNGNLMDYTVTYAGDGPTIEVQIVECPDPTGPFGAKGAGEPSIMLPAPAVANAVLDAVRVSVTSLPLTPEKLLAALTDRNSDEGLPV